MRCNRRLALFAAIFCAGMSAWAAAQQPNITVEIPFEKFRLDNGLTVVVHEDRKAPIVAVNVWYHVGSKDEKRGKTGFAHLFEHLMFNGSENFNADYFQVLERIGATDLNGTTNNDRTNYFQNVPTSALDTVLWMESDRMGHFLGALDQAKLDEQRGVVQNEKRQGENQPYGRVEEIVTHNTYPAGHPYSWTVIGSMEDLDAASLDDVREWFRTYYGPNNAVVVLAGDIDVKTAREKMEKYFGSIPPGPPLAKPDVNVAKMTGARRHQLQDRVPQARVYIVWNVPEAFSRESHHLDVVAAILGRGKTSRLYKRLVYDDQIATDVNVYNDSNEIGGQFWIQATAQPQGDLARVERVIREELARFLDTGPTADEVRKAQTQFVADFVRGVERIGGFGGKSDVLAQGQVFTGDPAAYHRMLREIQAATTKDVVSVGRKWLADGAFILQVHPFETYAASASDVDRSQVPEPGTPPPLDVPPLQRDKLSNGLSILLAERHEIPVVDFWLVVDSGTAADQFATPGTASLAMTMLDGGTTTRNALQISEEAAMLGASISASSNLDTCTVSLSALKSNLDKSLELYADITLNPTYPQADFQRERQQRLARIQREKSHPFQLALRVLPTLIYGAGHAYGNPFTGSGTTESVAAMTREDLAQYHATWFKPNNAMLVIVGDTKLAEVKPILEKLFAGWKPGDVPQKNLATVAQQDVGQVYLIDRPDAQQSVIMAGHAAPPKYVPEEVAIETLNTVLGGMFTSRLNMNLREEKHWTYGARTLLVDAKGQRPFLAVAPVQTDKTRAAMEEIQRELTEITGSRPVSDEELAMAKDNLTLQLPGQLETKSGVGSYLREVVTYGIPDDYLESYPAQVRALDAQNISAAAGAVLQPSRLIWVVVGDRAKIEAELRQFSANPIRLLDADGKSIQ